MEVTPVEESGSTFLPVKVLTLLTCQHRLVLKEHNKPISALAFDKSGARMAIGGMNYDIAMYDFAGKSIFFFFS